MGRLDQDHLDGAVLAQWHEDEARAAEQAAARTALPMQRARYLDAARMHRQSAELALRECCHG